MCALTKYINLVTTIPIGGGNTGVGCSLTGSDGNGLFFIVGGGM